MHTHTRTACRSTPSRTSPTATPTIIREVTDLIWVDRAIGYIRENYEPDSIVTRSVRHVGDPGEVIEGSLEAIADLPDRIGQADDVGWEARGDDAFLSSHRILSADPANEFVSRTIANCLYRRGRMVEEWVVRDSLAIALQLGLDPDEEARGKTFRGYVGSFTEPGQPDVLAAGQRPTSGRLPTRGRDGAEFIQQSGTPRPGEGEGLHGP